MGEQQPKRIKASRTPAAARLRQVLVAHFDMNDLELLAQEVGAKWDDLRGDTLAIKAIALVRWAENNERLFDLMVAVIKVRPHLDWSLVP